MQMRPIDQKKFTANLQHLFGLYRIVPIKAEYRLLAQSPSGLWYTGTADLIGTVNGVLQVLDLKTGRSKLPMHGVQVAAYCYGLGITHGSIMYVTDSGSPTLIEVDVDKGIDIFDKMLVTYMALIEGGPLSSVLDMEDI